MKISVVAHLPNAPYKGKRADIINFFCFTDKFDGTINNNEPDKCENIAWYDLDNLPNELMKHIFKVIKAHKNNETYVIWNYDEETKIK